MVIETPGPEDHGIRWIVGSGGSRTPGRETHMERPHMERPHVERIYSIREASIYIATEPLILYI
jgi:hypothetical protein